MEYDRRSWRKLCWVWNWWPCSRGLRRPTAFHRWRKPKAFSVDSQSFVEESRFRLEVHLSLWKQPRMVGAFLLQDVPRWERLEASHRFVRRYGQRERPVAAAITGGDTKRLKVHFWRVIDFKLSVFVGLYDAIIHVGDFAYDMNSDNARVGDEFMNQIQSIAAYVPYQVCPGNHEEA